MWPAETLYVITADNASGPNAAARAAAVPAAAGKGLSKPLSYAARSSRVDRYNRRSEASAGSMEYAWRAKRAARSRAASGGA